MGDWRLLVSFLMVDKETEARRGRVPRTAQVHSVPVGPPSAPQVVLGTRHGV